MSLEWLVGGVATQMVITFFSMCGVMYNYRRIKKKLYGDDWDLYVTPTGAFIKFCIGCGAGGILLAKYWNGWLDSMPHLALIPLAFAWGMSFEVVFGGQAQQWIEGKYFNKKNNLKNCI